jgi:hypothetical protein
MDEERQIRFLIAPFFLYASLLSWAFIDPYLRCSLSELGGGSLKETLSILAAAGAATFPIGFSIGTLGTFILKGFFWVWSRVRSKGVRQIYEAWVTKDAFSSMLLVTRSPYDHRDGERCSLLYVVATFDHELLPKGVHEWLRRRFNAFIVAFNSALAIVISLVIIGIRSRYSWPFDLSCGLSEVQWRQQLAWAWGGKKCWWLATNLGLATLLLFAARNSWRETMHMLKFQAHRTNVDELRGKEKK